MARRRGKDSTKVASTGGAVRARSISGVRRHEVQVLRRAGVSPTKVAELVGISRRSVQRIEQEAGARFTAIACSEAKNEQGGGEAERSGTPRSAA